MTVLLATLTTLPLVLGADGAAPHSTATADRPALTSRNEWFASGRGGEDAWRVSDPADLERSTAMLTKWNPFYGRIARSSSPMRAFDQVFRDADSLLRAPLFDDSFFKDMALPSNWSISHLAPAADVIETADEIEVKMDLPGHDPNSLQVKLEGNTLTVQSERKQQTDERGQGFHRAERSYGMFSRSFVLPRSVDAQRGEAKYAHGVLTVTLPKREDAKPKTITIKVDS
jgi:HSP20 family protein